MTSEPMTQSGVAPRRSAWIAVALLIVASSVLFLWRLGDRGLWSTHEARAARIAEAMLETGDWVELRLNPWTPTYQKPPLYYWTVAALARVSGGEVTPLVTRLPAALATIATVLVVYLFGRQLKGHAVGLIAAGAFMAAMHLLRASRTANLDSMLVLWTTLAFYFFWWAWRREGGWPAYLPMFGAIALGI
ncbi:MAG: glycosyltransferase family 39 protein, partial [Planctomycetes bacterium]|nr:glycosyltransferase family 39 protein [Planctomycetota bacterium]